MKEAPKEVGKAMQQKYQKKDTKKAPAAVNRSRTKSKEEGAILGKR